jgi:hypothetical protein
MTKPRKPGRRSADSLATPTPVVPDIKRLPPPETVSGPARAVWLVTVNSQEPEFFQPEHVPMLESYCESVVQARALNYYLSQITPAAPDYASVIRTAMSVQGMVARLATRLRLTPQSRWQPAQAAAMAARAPVGPKPWDRDVDWAEHSEV